jgi:CRISPR system Cascade subunit CasA
MPEYVLTEEPWIPCETADGARIELGLRETLERAHELRAVSDNSPVITASLHRLLLAILHRCFGPEDEASWLALYRAGRFDPQRVGTYVDRWKSRFDLLEPHRPFYQCVDDNMRKFGADPPARLVLERSNYGAPVALFQSRPTTYLETMPLPLAARLVVAFHAYTPGGLIRKPSEPPSGKAGPLNRGAFCLVTGKTLFETLVLNLLVYRPNDSLPIPGQAESDKPAWESDEPTTPTSAVPRGWLELLTWQSRRLLLRLDETQRVVAGVVVAVGRGLEGGIRDPMLAWRRSEKTGFFPVSFSPDRAFWRDVHALFISGDPENSSERPKTLSQLSQAGIRATVGEERRFELSLFGLSGDQAKIFLVRSERLPAPSRVLADPDLGLAVREALGAAETGANSLRDGTRRAVQGALAHGDRRPDPADVTRMARHVAADDHYWGELRVEFELFLDALAVDEAAASARFREAVLQKARRAFERVERGLGTSGHQLHAGAEGRRQLEYRLAELISKEQSA